MFSSGDLVEDLTHNFFLETGARNNKLKVYEMVDHPAARALTGYLLVRGGVHQVAYARALERLTGADLMKLFPSPRIPTDKIPECRPHIKRGDHLRLYRFSPSDYRELAAVFNGPHPETGEELEVVDQPPEGVPPTTCRRSPPSSRPTTRPRRSRRSPRSCASRPACRRSPPARSRTAHRASSARSPTSSPPERPAGGGRSLPLTPARSLTAGPMQMNAGGQTCSARDGAGGRRRQHDMSTPLTDAEQAERQARIQEDIRRLFARYRRTGQAVTRYGGPAEQAQASRFSRQEATARPSRAG